ncbi:MAG: hypothetical protein ACLRSW_10200 [Christensenellaceae bacterium]
MESYGQSGGYFCTARMRKEITTPRSFRENVRDVAYVYMGGEKAALRAHGLRRLPNILIDSRSAPEFKGRRRVDVLVEALGRVNYGERMPDLKEYRGVSESPAVDGIYYIYASVE